MGIEKRDIRPDLLKFGVAFALSIGGILYSFLINKRIKASKSPPDPRKHSDCNNQMNSGSGSWVSRSDHQASQIASNSPHFDPLATDKHESSIPVPDLSASSRSNGDKDAHDLLPEFNDLVKEFNTAGKKPAIKDSEPQRPKDTHEQEIKSLKNLVKILKERESNLEIQLLEYYGLKEQETAVMELQNRLKLNNMEAKLFALKIESLHADNRRLEAQMTDYKKAVSDLEAARSKIKLLKKKLRSETEQNKKQIVDFQQEVREMQQDELKNVVGNDSEIRSNLDKLTGLEAEVEELRKTNRGLQLENSDLARRLDCVQMLATSVLEDSETEKLKEETQNLKKQNEDLSKELESLQADRCSDLEELVYLRWINACLRYELRNYQPGPGKTIARDLSKTLSPRSEEKAKQLILEYANKEGGGAEKGIDLLDIDSDRWSSSQASVITDSGDHFDETSVDDSSHHKSNNNKFFGKLMRVLRGKPGQNRNHSRNPSLGRSESGGDDLNSCSDSNYSVVNLGSSSENRRSSEKRSVDSQRLTHRHSDDCFYKQIDSIGEGGGGGGDGGGSCSSSSCGKKSELVKYAKALKDSRSTSNFKFHRSSPSLCSL